MLIKSKKIKYIKKEEQKVTGFMPSDFMPSKGKPKNEKAADHQSRQGEIERRIQAAAKEAYDQGFAEGMLRGGEVEKKRLHSALTAFEKATGDLVQLKQHAFEKLEPDVLDLAISVAEKIIHQEIQTNRNVFMGVLKEAVRNISDREGIKIRLNPKDHEHMLEVNPAILSSFEGVKDPVFEKDDTLSPGDVMIETLFGEIDARLDRQMVEIKSALSRTG
jgi:flagellar assembly protein FliH